MSINRENWHTDHMPPGYPKGCGTKLLKDVIQDLNDEYVTKKKNGKINVIWENIISSQIEAGNEELRQRTPLPNSKSSRFSMDNPIVWIVASLILVILVAAIWFWADKVGAPLIFGSK